MTPPSYARPTISSARRASLNRPKTDRSKNIPETTEGRLINKGYISIKPLDSSRSCPFATLPSELRSQIYEYTFHESLVVHRRYIDGRYKYGRILWPNILRVCEAIRIEAAYIFYARTEFSATIIGLDFSIVTDWVDRLPLCHRAHLTRNCNMNIIISLPDHSRQFRFAEIPTSVLWTDCQRFGNLYSLSRGTHRYHFICFCHLANWWLWCSKPIQKDIQWHYQVRTVLNILYGPCEDKMMTRFLEECLVTVTLPHVQKSWVRSRKEMRMKKEALNMLEEFDRMFENMSQKKRWREHEYNVWKQKMEATKRFVGNW